RLCPRWPTAWQCGRVYVGRQRCGRATVALRLRPWSCGLRGTKRNRLRLSPLYIISPIVKHRMAKTGHLQQIGEENVFVAEDPVAASTEAPVLIGGAWLAMTPAVGTAPAPDGAADPSEIDADLTAPSPVLRDGKTG